MSNSSLPKIQPRENYIDMCKAIGIALVILGHTYSIPNALYTSIYSFHMPMFFMLSGLVYNHEKNNALGFGIYVLKKIKSLLIPYFIFSFANLILNVIWRLLITNSTVDINYFITNIKGIFLCYSNIENMPNCSPLWFLVCLFIAELLFWWIMKLPLRFSWIPVVSGTIISYLIMPTENAFTAYPFKFPTFLVALLFVYMGYILRGIINKKPSFMNNRILMSVSSLFAMFIGFFVVFITDSNTNIDMNGNAYDNYFIFIQTSILISAGFILFFKQVTFLENKFWIWLGKNTLYIIAFNFVCRDIATELYYYVPVLNRIPMHWSINFIMTFALCCLSVIICIKIKSLFFKIFSNRTK